MCLGIELGMKRAAPNFDWAALRGSRRPLVTVGPGRLRAWRNGLRWSVLRLLLSCAMLFCAGRAQAQNRDPLSALSAGAHRTIEQLNSLNAIPAGDWKFHVGDVAHGEATETDDSAWQTVTENSRAPTEAVWYRRWIEVPKTLNGYDLSGARVWFQFEAYANGPMPQIIYFNGRRVAMGDDLEPIVLFDHAQPGERVLVAV